MPAPVTVPRLGWSMDEGIFLGWLRQDGEHITAGEPLFTLEAEKATQTIEALDSGTLHCLIDGPNPGDRVKVGQVLAHIVGAGESSPAEPVRRRRAITPRARRAARQMGIDPAQLVGSGRNGRVRERDVRSARPALPGRLVPHTAARRALAARMIAGVNQAAPVTLTTRVDGTRLIAVRTSLLTEGVPASYTVLLARLTAVALSEHPLLQAQWRDEGLFLPEGCHIAIAVDTASGLLAPVLRHAERRTIRELAMDGQALVARAHEGTLEADCLRDATFTISNLGMHGIDAFTPIITLPQCAVLGVGQMRRELVLVDDQIVPRDLLTLSLTFDHRIVDGAPAARFLATLRQSIEEPERWLLAETGP